MKHLLMLFTLLCCHAAVVAQSEKKGPVIYRYARVYIDIENASGWDLMPLYNYDALFEPTTDTILYELQESDTALLILAMEDEIGYLGDGFDFDAQVDYGTPIYPDGVLPFPTSTTMRFADSAQVTFCINGNGVRTHMLKLTKKAAPAAIPETAIVAPPFAVYPNPSGNVLNIQSEAGCRFIIYSADGRLVAEIGPDDAQTIDLSGFGSGVYRISQIKDGTVLQTLPFVRM